MVSGIDLMVTSALKYFHVCSRCTWRYTLVYTHAWMTIWGARNVRCMIVYAKVKMCTKTDLHSVYMCIYVYVYICVCVYMCMCKSVNFTKTKYYFLLRQKIIHQGLLYGKKNSFVVEVSFKKSYKSFHFACWDEWSVLWKIL